VLDTTSQPEQTKISQLVLIEVTGVQGFAATAHSFHWQLLVPLLATG
jgi:hypothetical protein